MLRNFTTEALTEIVKYLEAELARSQVVSISVPHPDIGKGQYSGEWVAGVKHRSLRVWLDLAEQFKCRLLLPDKLSANTVKLTFEKLRAQSWLRNVPLSKTEKYGLASGYARIHKLEEASFLLTFLEALRRIDLKPGARILSLGVNTGEELKALEAAYKEPLTVVGIDHSASAVAKARDYFANYSFIEADINRLETLGLEPFDLILSLGTLQSPSIDDRTLLRYLVQNLLKEKGSVCVAWPNSHYQDGELLYGARTKNFRQPELSLVIKDIAFYKKYLQQHGFKVHITGKYYLFVTALKQ